MTIDPPDLLSDGDATRQAGAAASAPLRPGRRLHAPLLGAAAVAAALSMLPHPPAAAQVYSCIDGHGRRLQSDRPIPECAGREQRVLNADGSTRRIIPSDEERAKREAEDRARREEQAALAEKRRIDRLLLQRFPDEAAWERSMRDALAEPLRVVDQSVKRIGELDRAHRRLLDEAEFYKKTQMPAELKRKLDENRTAVDLERRTIEAQTDEIKRIQQRYTADLTRLYRIWAEQAQR
jgi:hypothetical protein